jgi:hypothetical protein
MKIWLGCILSIMLIYGKDTLPNASSHQEVPRPADLPKMDFLAFKPGEKLEFSLRYSFITAGHAIMEVKNDIRQIEGRDHYHLYIEGKSNKFFDGLFLVRDYYESFIDKNTLLPSLYNRDITENKYKRNESYVFDRIHNKVKMEGRIDSVPPGVFDIISVFYNVRCVDFSRQPIGTEYKLNTYFDKELFPVGATYTGRSTVTTGLGKFNVLVFRPKLIEGRIFKNQADMTLYVSDDSNHVPIRIESAVYMDYVRADLSSFQNLKYTLSSKIGK